ncbi:apolipoprotein M isoform X2 [Malaclemys terrapin pileata]|uniref:apolipoprotein M isoform X2 n=1 Tax=Malaclemys terrapin pileata TaxID=2991368 RepID=UPI0023A89D5B|nr:apolipoprotein M isoform X2 [Malaclemys terrapin pileata]
MLQRTWSYLLYLYGALISALSPCTPPAPLPASGLDRDQYLGTWHFIAAAAASPAALETFAGTDGSVFHMGQGPQPQRLQLRAALRLKSGVCVPRSWIYLLNEGSTDLATEGRPGMRTELFSSKCPDTIIVQETDRDYQRILLYSRTPDLADECIEDFRSQAYCLDMEEFLLTPRSQDTCQLRDS